MVRTPGSKPNPHRIAFPRSEKAKPRRPTVMGVVIVTGGSRGIGADICRLAARRGYSVCVNYLRGESKAASVAEEIRTGGGRAISVKADVTIEADVRTMFEAATAQLGPVTALVNNAGWGGEHGPIESWQIEATRKLI